MIKENEHMIKLIDLECKNNDIDLDKYINFREDVKKSMEHPEWLGDFSKEDLISMIDNGSKIWIYYYDSIPICSMMFIPSNEKSAIKLGLNDYDYTKIGDYGPMMVNPKYIENKLQYQMLKEIDKYSMNLGLKYTVGTIHPDNMFSINNLVRDGFVLISQKKFSRGIRNIYLKKL